MAFEDLASWLVSRAEILPSLAEEYASKFTAANISSIDELQAKGIYKLETLLALNSSQWPKTMIFCRRWV